jgi:hypothetical protein
MSGKTSTVFAHILRGLSGAKITRAKEDVFRGVASGGCSVRCSYKADDGFLYPLDKAFFYVHKPPMCINHRCVLRVDTGVGLCVVGAVLDAATQVHTGPVYVSNASSLDGIAASWTTMHTITCTNLPCASTTGVRREGYSKGTGQALERGGTGWYGMHVVCVCNDQGVAVRGCRVEEGSRGQCCS